jgi:hypothetical protein
MPWRCRNAPSWPTNLIGYNGLTSYGSPSYYAQTLFADSLGDQVQLVRLVTRILAHHGTVR